MNDWKRELASPAHACFAGLIRQLPSTHFPGCADLNALTDAQHRSGGGKSIRFVPHEAATSDGEPYEARIFRSGEIATREGNWHDLFNALAWLAFPATKCELNRIHGEQLSNNANRQNARGTARDVLTLFDESGVLVACADAALAALLTGFRWKDLFWTRRADVERNLCMFVFGHALHEQVLTPFPGITGKALILDVEEDFLQLSLSAQLALLDERAAGWFATHALDSTRLLAPLPILGIPGWDSANAAANYYDNAAVFRPGRRRST